MISGQIAAHLRRIQWIKLLSFFAILGLGLLVLGKVENMLVSFLLAFVISYLLAPFVNLLERYNLNRTLAISFVFLFAGLLVFFVVLFIAPWIGNQLSSLQTELPKYIESLSNSSHTLSHHIRGFSGQLITVDIPTWYSQRISEGAATAFASLPKWIGKTLAILLIAPFFAFFMLKDGKLISRSMLQFVPNHLFELTLNLYYQINDQMGQFIRARLFESAIIGGLTWVGLFSIGLPYAALLAIFAGITNLIPYVGPIIGAIPALLVVLVNGGGGVDYLAVTLVYGAVQIIDIAFIIPLLVARTVNLHPVTVIVVITIGAQLMGVLGMIISIPLASAMKLTLSAVYNHLIEFRI